MRNITVIETAEELVQFLASASNKEETNASLKIGSMNNPYIEIQETTGNIQLSATISFHDFLMAMAEKLGIDISEYNGTIS